MQKSAVIIALVVALLVGAASGFAVGKGGGSVIPVGAPLSQAERERAFKDGYDAARNDINDIFVSKGLSYPLDYEIKDVFGTVVEVQGDSFVIEYDLAQFTVLQEGTARKTVRLSVGVSLMKMVDAAEDETGDVKADLAPRGSIGRFVAEPGDPSVPTTPPAVPKTPVPPPDDSSQSVKQKSVIVAIKDLQVGDYVQVKAADDVQQSGDQIMASEATVLNLRLPPGTKPQYAELPFARTFGKTAPSIPAVMPPQ